MEHTRPEGTELGEKKDLKKLKRKYPSAATVRQCYVLAARVAQRGRVHARAPGMPPWLALSLPGATRGPCGPNCCLVSLPTRKGLLRLVGQEEPWPRREDPCASGPPLNLMGVCGRTWSMGTVTSSKKTWDYVCYGHMGT